MQVMLSKHVVFCQEHRFIILCMFQKQCSIGDDDDDVEGAGTKDLLWRLHDTVVEENPQLDEVARKHVPKYQQAI